MASRLDTARAARREGRLAPESIVRLTGGRNSENSGLSEGGVAEGGKSVSWKFRTQEVRRARVLAWTLQCVTGACDTEEPGGQHAL